MNSQSTPNASIAIWNYAFHVMQSGRLFKNWTIGNLAAALKIAVERGNLVWVKGDDNSIQALALFTPNHTLKYIEVDNWVVESKSAMRALFAEFRRRFPGYALGGVRPKKNSRIFVTQENTEKFFERMLRYGS